MKLLGSLPLINVITGIVVAALTSEGGTDALGINVLIALFVSFTVSFEAHRAAPRARSSARSRTCDPRPSGSARVSSTGTCR